MILILTEEEAECIHYALTQLAENCRKQKEAHWKKAEDCKPHSASYDLWKMLCASSEREELRVSTLAASITALQDVTKPYAWTIESYHDVGTLALIKEEGEFGRRGASKAAVDALREGGGQQFRLLNDEGEVCFEGRIVMCKTDDKPGFQPLQGVIGCVAIQYFDGASQTWITL